MSWNEIETLPAEMAAAVRPALETADRAAYARFLDAMVHYTRGSGDRLRHAAAHAPRAPLAGFFSRLAHEESGHFRLAEADLAAFGRAPGADAPAGVAAFHDAWMAARSPAAWLGALYVLENVGAHLGADAARHLARLGLGPRQIRFVLVHLEADVEHGAETARHAREEDPAALLEAARGAARFWVELHRAAFAG
jgi:hypothetical protein